MLEILFKTDYVTFEKTSYKNGRCKVSVRGKAGGKSLMDYRYLDVPLGFSSPYVSWANLNYCGGWTYNEADLHTAVQRGQKLYAGIVFDMFDENYAEQCKPRHNLPTEQDAVAIITRLEESIPDDCIIGIEKPDRQGYRCRFRHIFVCKQGCIADYIDTEEVFSAYTRLGIGYTSGIKSCVNYYCGVPIKDFSDSKFFDYTNPKGVQYIVTGLLLGYPLESTAYLLDKGKELHPAIQAACQQSFKALQVTGVCDASRYWRYVNRQAFADATALALLNAKDWGRTSRHRSARR